MRWSYRLFKVGGISVELHLLLAMILAVLLLSSPQAFLFYVLVFTIVLAHEFVHSAVAIIHGIRVPRILLTPLGGVASIELPDDPLLELKVAVAGPMFNFMLAGVGVVLIFALNSHLVSYDDVVSGSFFETFGMDSFSGMLGVLVSFNIVLGAFNMLPAFPMDGGRIFRSVLALWMDYAKATRIAATVGQFILLTITFIGILRFDLILAFIGLFLSYAGGSEMRYVNLRGLLGDWRLADIASDEISYANMSLTWREFMATVHRKGQSRYLLVDSAGVLKGVLDLGAVGKVAADRPVGESKTRDYVVLDGRIKAADALKVLLSCRLAIVVDQGKLVGYITAETLADSAAYMTLKKSLNEG
jgi:Zn-dependent protease